METWCEIACLTSVSSALLQAPAAASSTSRALYAAPSASRENMCRCGRPCTETSAQLQIQALNQCPARLEWGLCASLTWHNPKHVPGPLQPRPATYDCQVPPPSIVSLLLCRAAQE